jgi:hypothetical protein
MLGKRNQRRNSTPARGGASSNALTEFLPQLRKVRDESAAEFRDDLLSARTMGELQRDFASRLNRWCGTFPALLAGHAQNLCERGLSIEEVERELENAWSAIKGESRNWIALACDGELPTPDWRAPRYLAGFSARLIPTQRHIPLTMLRGPLDANETKRIVASVESSVEEHHDVTRAAALKHARNWIAEQARRQVLFSHSPKFNSIKYRGKRYELTTQQSQIVEMLNLARGSGFPEVRWERIRERLGTPENEDSRLRDSFKTSNLELIGTLIVPGKRRGTYRLNLPDLPA